MSLRTMRLPHLLDNQSMTIAIETPTELDLDLAWRNHFATLGSTFYTHRQPTPCPPPTGWATAWRWRARWD